MCQKQFYLDSPLSISQSSGCVGLIYKKTYFNHNAGSAYFNKCNINRRHDVVLLYLLQTTKADSLAFWCQPNNMVFKNGYK